MKNTSPIVVRKTESSGHRQSTRKTLRTLTEAGLAGSLRALKPTRDRSIYGRNRHSIVVGGNTVWQAHVPPAFAFIHSHDHGGNSRFVVHRIVQQQEIRPELCHRQGLPVQQQTQVYLGGMSALTRKGHGYG